MLRLQPSVIGVTKAEVNEFLDRYANRPKPVIPIILPHYTVTTPWTTHATLHRGPGRYRDDSIQESSVDSSPSAAMYDRDELELESPEVESDLFANVPSPSLLRLEPRPRRDSGISDTMVSHTTKVEATSHPMGPKHELPQKEETSSLTALRQEGDMDPGWNPHGQLSRRRHFRTTSDPGEPAPLLVERTRPSNALTRAVTTDDMVSMRISSIGTTTSSTIAQRSISAFSDVNTIDHDLSRHEVTLHAINHDRSPLERLVEDTEQLSLDDVRSDTRHFSSEVLRFPSFEASHSREVSLADTVSSHDFGEDAEPSSVTNRSSTRRLPDPTTSPGSSHRTVPLPSSPARSSPGTPTGRERLRALAASFASSRLFGRSPTTAQEGTRLSAESPALHNQSRNWTSTPSRPQAPRMMPLRDFAVVSGGRPLSASPMSPGVIATMSRSRAGEERENDDDSSQVEEEARFWRERVAIANNRDGNAGWEGRTPPSQGRFLRFLDMRR